MLSLWGPQPFFLVSFVGWERRAFSKTKRRAWNMARVGPTQCQVDGVEKGRCGKIGLLLPAGQRVRFGFLLVFHVCTLTTFKRGWHHFFLSLFFPFDMENEDGTI